MDPSLSNVLSSAEVQAFASGFPVMVMHLIVTLLLLAAGGDGLCPADAVEGGRPDPSGQCRRRHRLRRHSGGIGGAAGGVAVGVDLGARHRHLGRGDRGAAGFWPSRVVDLLLTGLPERIRHGEISAAVVLLGAKLATAVILSAALTG